MAPWETPETQLPRQDAGARTDVQSGHPGTGDRVDERVGVAGPQPVVGVGDRAEGQRPAAIPMEFGQGALRPGC